MISFAVLFIMEMVFLKMVWLPMVYMASEGQMNSLTALGSSVYCQKTRQSGGENPPWPLTHSCWCCWSWTPPCDSPGSSDLCSFCHWGSEGSSQSSCPPADRRPDSEWPSPPCRLRAHLNSQQDNQVNSTLQCGSISVKKRPVTFSGFCACCHHPFNLIFSFIFTQQLSETNTFS